MTVGHVSGADILSPDGPLTHPFGSQSTPTRYLVLELFVFTPEFELLGPERPDSGDAMAHPARCQKPGGKPSANWVIGFGEDETRTAAGQMNARTNAPHTSSYRHGI